MGSFLGSLQASILYYYGTTYYISLLQQCAAERCRPSGALVPRAAGQRSTTARLRRETTSENPTHSVWRQGRRQEPGCGVRQMEFVVRHQNLVRRSRPERFEEAEEETFILSRYDEPDDKRSRLSNSGANFVIIIK